MNKIKLILLLIVLSLLTSVVAQDDFEDFGLKKNGFFIEDLGVGGFLSVNYERMIETGVSSFLSMRVGFGFGGDGITSPHSLTMNIGKNNFYFEAGLGGSYSYGYRSVAMAGLRIQKPWGGFYYVGRVSVTLYSNQSSFNVPIGFAIGYNF
jgi:hypothetical protein